MTTGKAVAATEKHAVITEEMALALQGAAGEGREDLGREDYALPFLKIAQALSPEMTRGDAKQIPGLEVGDLLDSLSGEIYKGDTGVRVIYVAFEKKYIEWRPKKAGGGLVKIFDTLEAARVGKIPDVGNKDTDTEIIETAQIYVLAQGAAGWTPLILSWKKTQLKEARRWAALHEKQTFQKWGLKAEGVLPYFGVVYLLTTRMDKNSAGQPYAAPTVAPVGIVDPRTFEAAKQFRAVVKAGRVKVQHEQDAPSETAVSDEALAEANY